MSPVLSERHASVGRITFVALLLNILCVTTAELLLRTGASAVGGGATTSVFGFAALRSPATVVGICFHVMAFGFWMYALRTVPLTLAYNFTAVNQGLVPIAAWLVLPNEHISVMRWMGIGLVLAGFALLVPMLAKVEHDTEGVG
jgi:multidrug transporter EmrE-like cation transporter